MKKTILLFSLFCLSTFAYAQTYNYHRFETYATVEKACVGNPSDAFVVKVNLDIDHLLNSGAFYLIDFGSNFNLGLRYAKVLNRYSGTGDADFNLDGSGIGSSTDVCSYVINRYHRFETFTTLQKAKDRVCGNSTSHDGIWKANIMINRLLVTNKVYQINLGGSLGTRYCRILNRYNGRGDADFDLNGASIGNPISISCIVDSDGDGVPDSEDDCPNEAGPASNNGCPGSPDLTIDTNNTIISSACLSCASVLANIGSDRYLLKPQGSNMFVDIRVKNNGTASSSSSDVRYYLSSNNSLGGTDIPFESITNFSSISPNSYRDVNVTFDYYTVSGLISGATGNYFILMVVDEVDFNDESNENNNITPIPIRISNSASASLVIDTKYFSQNDNVTGEPFLIDIYNFSGQKILSREVNGNQEENTLIHSLPKNGIYIIKSKNDTRKVYVGHN